MIESEMNARAVIVRDEHILLARLKDDESYTFLPGGKFNVGEYDVDSGSSERDLSIYDALSREVKEEAGLTVTKAELLGVFENQWEDYEFHYQLNFLFAVETKEPVSATEDIPAQEGKLALLWSPLDKLSENNLLPRELQEKIPEWLEHGPADNWASNVPKS